MSFAKDNLLLKDFQILCLCYVSCVRATVHNQQATRPLTMATSFICHVLHLLQCWGPTGQIMHIIIIAVSSSRALIHTHRTLFTHKERHTKHATHALSNQPPPTLYTVLMGCLQTHCVELMRCLFKRLCKYQTYANILVTNQVGTCLFLNNVFY